MIIYNDIIQGTPEWFALRCGKFTASTFSDLFMAKSTKGYNEAINRVVFERITGEVPESYSNEYMERGKELEPAARQSYELETFNKIREIGFIEFDEWIGGSPDGLVGEDGILEIKVPKWSTLISYILDGAIPKDYMLQMQGNLLVSGRQWCDFYVWHPKFMPILRRVNRDETIIAEIQIKLKEVIEEAKSRIFKIKGPEAELEKEINEKEEMSFDKKKFQSSVDRLKAKIPEDAFEKFRKDFIDRHKISDVKLRESEAELYYNDLTVFVSNFLKDWEVSMKDKTANNELPF